MSKGGHSAKDDDDKVYFKHMVNFEGDSIDFNTITDLDTGHRQSIENESGVEYFIRIGRTVFPGEKIYAFESEDERDLKLLGLKEKMQILNTIFH